MVSGNFEGIVVIGYNLDAAGYRPDNTTITHNIITNSGNTGIVTNGSDSVFSSSTIDYNTYIYDDTSGQYWVWYTGATRTWDTWRGYKNDTNGTLTGP